jgi:hypothetical protein
VLKAEWVQFDFQEWYNIQALPGNKRYCQFDYTPGKMQVNLSIKCKRKKATYKD